MISNLFFLSKIFIKGAEPVDVKVELFSPQRIPLTNLIVNKEAREISIKGVTKDMDGQYLITVSNIY